MSQRSHHDVRAWNDTYHFLKLIKEQTEVTIDEIASVACFTAVNQATNEALYTQSVVTPGKRWLMQLTEKGERWLEEAEAHLEHERRAYYRDLYRTHLDEDAVDGW